MNTRGQESSVSPIGTVAMLILLVVGILIFLALSGRLGGVLSSIASMLRIGGLQ